MARRLPPLVLVARRPAGVRDRVSDHMLIDGITIPGDPPVRARLYRAAAPQRGLVWLHGGAFCFGDLDMPEGDATSRWFAARGYEVLSVDYRLAPVPDFESVTIGTGGHPFPAAIDDIVTAFDWMTAHVRELGLDPDAIILGGASAGGNLAAGVAVGLRDRGTAVPAALYLAYPVLHATLPTPGPEAAAALAGIDPERRFPLEVARMKNLNYLGGNSKLLSDPRAFAGDGDVSGFPPTIIVNADHDDLRCSGETFGSQLAAAGVEVCISHEPGSQHGYLNETDLPFAERTLAAVAQWLTAAPSPAPQMEKS